MQTVHKFALAPTVKMPPGATILRVDFDPGSQCVCLWALVDPDPELTPEPRHFAMAKTGESLPDGIADCPHLVTLITPAPAADGSVKVAVTHVWEVPGYLVKTLHQ